MTQTNDHGGNLDAAMQRFGGARGDWIDLSTGINPVPYPVPALPLDAWQALPRKSDMARLYQAAGRAFGTDAPMAAFAGAQGAIQAIPHLRAPGQARVLAPTYNEHASTLRVAGWQVAEVATLDALAGADLAVVVNPNNPDGQRHDPAGLRALAGQVGLLVVDESFVDPEPALSVLPGLAENMIVLRSFGKFYGLAGMRLGFAMGAEADRLQALAGPWPVSGPAIEIACAAYADHAWQADTIARLTRDAARLDDLARAAGWQIVGGTTLFRTYDTLDAVAAQEALARAHIWSRIFPYSPRWIRLGMAAPEGWAQVETAFAAISAS